SSPMAPGSSPMARRSCGTPSAGYLT
ncbi:MAG: hypothetical protein AVDCRST_MAG15-3216, partial [uncultured Rubellimicrobium sp.]